MSVKAPKKLIYLCILIAPFLLLFLRSDLLTPIKFKVLEISSLPIQIISFPFKEAKKMLFYHRTFEEYKRLKREVDTLQARLIGMQELVKENSRLTQLLKFKGRLVYSSVAARVVGRDPSHWNASMIIDRGSNDGIKIGMPVVNTLGVVGKIFEVAPNKAKVMLLTDPQFSVAAVVADSRETGLVSGSLQGVCRLTYIDPNADVRAGDEVITAPLSTSFPEGLMIGTITEIKEYSPSNKEYLITPAVVLSQIEEVVVIIME